jgi:hypothetical protein
MTSYGEFRANPPTKISFLASKNCLTAESAIDVMMGDPRFSLCSSFWYHGIEIPIEPGDTRDAIVTRWKFWSSEEDQQGLRLRYISSGAPVLESQEPAKKTFLGNHAGYAGPN